ncbi:phosphotransferase family protein [Streptomyces sp. NBC_00162]|uniref:phosphotransferase family protein n=1 Tax=Streptomyces sp. NBC_00162 TaxID=2903629 RepID=UPI00214CC494|nr:aminoglycoside phosphotransferase family protein [Streptomyces sp. NBC_00162]UUU37526.1 aminoglycoside phosphotransferase family protein [Streptomyces sp. NBC_00162]
MELHVIERSANAFQQGLTDRQILAVARRAFGPGTEVRSATELGGGMYNTTYRIDLAGHQEPVVLRVAPEPGRQFHSEQGLMRSEYASVPWLAPIAELMPRVLASDFTQTVIGRDWMIQSLLPGTPAPELLGSYPKGTHGAFFRQMGEITAAVHVVAGPHFGPVTGPGHDRWSSAVVASLHLIAEDVESCGLDAADLRKAADAAQAGAGVLDEVTVPRLLTGDLWTVNTMLAAAPVPTICGVLDMDRTWWGDPEADWTLRMARAKQDARLAFFDSYGRPEETEAGAWRRHVYEVRHLGALRLERHRLGNHGGVQESYRR